MKKSRPAINPSLRTSAAIAAWLFCVPLRHAVAFDYPVASTDSTHDHYFGVSVADPYRGLENGKSPQVRAWVQAEDRLARNTLQALPNRASLTRRLKALLYTNELEMPADAGGRLFYERRSVSEEKPVLYWREGARGVEHVLLNPNTWVAHEHIALGDWLPSPDGKMLLYQSKLNNADIAVQHLLEVATGKERVDESIAGADFADPAWASDSRGFYYMRLPTTSTLEQKESVAQADIRFHRLGTPPLNDAMIYPKTNDDQLYLSPAASRDGHWLFVSVIHGWTNDSITVKNLRAKSAVFVPLFTSTSTTASVQEWNDSFYLNTNEGAPHHRIVRVSSQTLPGASWDTVIPERPDVTIEEMKIIGGSIVLLTLKNAVNQIELYTLDGHFQRTVPLPGLGEVSELSGREDRPDFYYRFESFTTAPQIFKASVASHRVTLWGQEACPIDPSSYQVSQQWFPSKDGTPVSMFIVQRGTAPKNTPFLLLGYGGFNEPMIPRFDPTLYPWLEAGGGVAVVNLRGGGEYGEAWHRAGMLTHKQNSFDDFAAAAEFLIQKKYARPDKLAMQGASNGGLLIAAELTQHPDLFKAVVCKVPLTDMLRYERFGEGAAWIPEYGSVLREDEFRALYAYSPYQHVTAGVSYPSVLLISAENDDRVDPMHARKMAAALQAANRSAHPILLETLHHAGHGGSGATDDRVQEYTDRLSFLFHALDLNPH